MARLTMKMLAAQNKALYEAVKNLLQDRVADAETWAKSIDPSDQTWTRKADQIFPFADPGQQ